MFSEMEITDIDGNVLIKQGTLVNGTIHSLSKFKTKGKLSFI